MCRESHDLAKPVVFRCENKKCSKSYFMFIAVPNKQHSDIVDRQDAGVRTTS